MVAYRSSLIPDVKEGGRRLKALLGLAQSPSPGEPERARGEGGGSPRAAAAVGQHARAYEVPPEEQSAAVHQEDCSSAASDHGLRSLEGRLRLEAQAGAPQGEVVSAEVHSDVAAAMCERQEEASLHVCRRLLQSTAEHGAPVGHPPRSGTLSVTVLSAKNLRSADWLGGSSDPYCVCEILGRPQSKFQTPAIKGTLHPVWNHSQQLHGYVAGDSLQFTLWDQDWGKPDDHLGKAVLQGKLFEGCAFEGELPLAGKGRGSHATLRVRVVPGGSPERPLFRTSWTSRRVGIGGMRNDFAGDVGFAFVPRVAIAVAALGRQLSPGQTVPRGVARVTLWTADSQTALASECVGPGCTEEGGYAYAAVPGAPVHLEAGREYRLSQQCTVGMPDPWFDGTVDAAELGSSAALEVAEFRGSVFCHGYGFPTDYDSDGRFPTQYRRAGMLNLKVASATDDGLPSGHPGLSLPSTVTPNLAGPLSLGLPGALTPKLPGSVSRAERPDRLVIRLVCMSPGP